MHLVNTEGRTKHVALATLIQPGFIGPGEFASIPDYGGILGRRLEKETIGIGFKQDMAVQITDFVFVQGAFAHARYKDLPNTRGTERTHLVKPAVPVIEIADDANALGVGRPDGKAGAGHTINGAQLRAELI